MTDTERKAAALDKLEALVREHGFVDVIAAVLATDPSVFVQVDDQEFRAPTLLEAIEAVPND